MNYGMMELVDGLIAASEIVFACTNSVIDTLVRAPWLYSTFNVHSSCFKGFL